MMTGLLGGSIPVHVGLVMIDARAGRSMAPFTFVYGRLATRTERGRFENRVGCGSFGAERSRRVEQPSQHEDSMKPEDSNVELAVQSQPLAEVSGRAPYRRPALRRLGSVRELTLGSPMGDITDKMGGLKTL
jgi:hypothetical protein